jgi:glycosyltransferase involved in cell wall biosynthesis
VTPNPNPQPRREDDEFSPRAPEGAEREKRLASAETQCRALAERNRVLDELVRATEELLEEARDKVRANRRKRIEADHYRNLLHQLRSRWYLRPFIPREKLLLLSGEESDGWIFRGPRFAAPAQGVEPRRPRILIVGHLLSSMLFGSENSLIETIAAIDPARFDLFAVFPEANENVFAALRAQVQGIAVLDYSWWRMGRPASEETVSAFTTLLREQAIDLVHVNTIMVRDPLLAARRLGLPSIVHVRELISLDDELAQRLGGTPAQIASEVCANTTYILANSASTLADYPCHDRGSFIYNSVSDRALDLPNLVDPRRINVGMVSSNLRKKGVLDFVALAGLAADVLPQLQFHLIGPESAPIKAWRAQAVPRPRNLSFRDYVSSPPCAYRGLNIVLNLSRFAESFGRTVAEAMAARRPVVAYRYGALPELIDDGETGFLVPYLDLPAVLDRLRFFVEQPAKIAEFGETARQRSLERFSRDVFADRINALYERLIAEARQRR